MLQFRSSKNYYMLSLLWILIAFLLFMPLLILLDGDYRNEDLIGIIIVFAVTGMLIWIMLDTRYIIKEDALFYCSGPIRGTIKIQQIRKVENWNKWYVTSFIKPALGNEGLIIYYNKFDDIYISPKNKTAFIAALREINPSIEVV